jgi:NAD-dependent DNA ligase
VDDAEREDLLYFLQKMVGPDHGQHGDVNVATRLPIDEPAPALVFAGSEFVFTGRFIWGTRDACQQAVEQRGGTSGSNITKRTAFLVLGDLGSRDWVHTSFGRKIQKAVEYRDLGVPLAVVDERHWVAHL